MRRTFKFLAGFLLGLLMTNSADSSKTEDLKPSSLLYPRPKATLFMQWFLQLVERAENQSVKIEPLSEKESRIFDK
jgi:hypothetical protein